MVSDHGGIMPHDRSPDGWGGEPTTLSLLRRAYQDRKDDIAAKDAEIARLRGLVKAAEQGTEGICNWCNVGLYGDAHHSPDCPAFHPDGEVR